MQFSLILLNGPGSPAARETKCRFVNGCVLQGLDASDAQRLIDITWGTFKVSKHHSDQATDRLLASYSFHNSADLHAAGSDAPR